jgi:hypothetical protein
MAGKKIYISSHIYSVLYYTVHYTIAHSMQSHINTLQVVVYPTNNSDLNPLFSDNGISGDTKKVSISRA